jgi:hypothetical protein
MMFGCCQLGHCVPMIAAGRTTKAAAAMVCPVWELDRHVDLSQPISRNVSLIEINLRQFRFVVPFTRATACYDGVPRCVTTAFRASNHGLPRLVTS